MLRKSSCAISRLLLPCAARSQTWRWRGVSAAALTPRQRQVCELAAHGKSNREIAHELFLSIKTVETHLALCFQKLGVSARGDLGAALSA